jgi:hypothetical protein
MPGWVHEAWAPEKTTFMRELVHPDAVLILDNLRELPIIDYPAEQMLVFIAEHYLGLIWQFMKDRLDDPREKDFVDAYEAMPHHFQLMMQPLSKEAELADSTAFGWYSEDSELLTYRGGKVFEAIFPKPTTAVSDALVQLVNGGEKAEAEFALDLMQNYHGEAEIHDVFKAVIRRYHDDPELMSEVSRALQHAGVVHGEFGCVDSAREKRELISNWIDDNEPAILMLPCEYPIGSMICVKARGSSSGASSATKFYI